ncbi:HAMP domain-containing sensor histidine kinase [Galbitalea soli]|uniref:sensor histidine kinase n=1 Tax=Galbitalea soli TaxID=1268042 RepID=UPI00184F39A7|nr:signal transduction histidine kinase [Galbitalea soli]
MSWADLATVGAITGASSLGVTGIGVVLLLALRRASLLAQLVVVVAVAATAIVVSMVAVARWMFLSQHDLTVAITVAAVAATIALLFSISMGAIVTRNLRSLTAAARGIGEGRLVSPGDVGAGIELRRLATELAETSRTLDESRLREQRLETARRDLIAGISHDLRTPLAGIRAMAEALEDGMVDDQGRYLREMRVRVDHLSGLVDDLFELSKIDAGLLTLTVSEVALYDLVSDAVAELGPLAADRRITVVAEHSADLTVRADPRELARAISNLLVNAVQHTAPGTPITVQAGRAPDGRPTISVIDEGGGIPEADLARVFDAGWRGTAARAPLAGMRTGGAGLGLTIVRGIIEAHRGEISVRNLGRGCRFDLILPS